MKAQDIETTSRFYNTVIILPPYTVLLINIIPECYYLSVSKGSDICIPGMYPL